MNKVYSKVDNYLWPDSPPNEAGYIHKLCFRRDFAGKNLLKNMIEYAKEHTTFN